MKKSNFSVGWEQRTAESAIPMYEPSYCVFAKPALIPAFEVNGTVIPQISASLFTASISKNSSGSVGETYQVA